MPTALAAHALPAFDALPGVDAAINYIDRPSPPVITYPFKKGNQANLPREPHTMRIADARRVLDELSLDTNGFIMVRHRTAVTDFLDQDQIEKIYRREIEELVRQVTGAEKVVVFHMLRRKEGGEALPPARIAHIDFSGPCYRRWTEALLPPDEAARYLKRRFLSVNVWRPVRPVEMVPLALCDARTVSTNDLKDTLIIGPSETETMNRREGIHVMHNPAHRWYYLSAQRPEETWIMKQYDSDPAYPTHAPHAAFDDPTSAPGAAQRESFEVRTLAFMPA
jgi:hypothetical protein